MMTVTGATIRAAILGVALAATAFAAVGGAGNAMAAQPNGPVQAVHRIAPVQPIGPVQTRFPACVYPHGAGPGYNASIGNQENGKTVCLALGEKLLVSLSAPTAKSPKWSHIQVSPSGVLTTAPLTLMLSPGMTATNFLASHPGAVDLTSQRHVCPPSTNGTVSCDVMVAWRATVVVRGGTKPLPEVRF
ncbi:MAG TPA: hypothetical protein VMF65_25265 [Acidimicrobiales bacterium]|nr:hypothetical protein [Acidimicrobiales bacterium]